jgi:hypothetical protein
MRTVIVTDPPRADIDKVSTLGEYGVATVHEAVGRNGFLGPQLRPAHLGSREAAQARVDKEEATGEAFRAGELGLDRYGMRTKLAELGVEYVPYQDPANENG